MQEQRFMIASEHIQQNRILLPEPDLSNRNTKRQELNKALKECFGERFERICKNVIIIYLIQTVFSHMFGCFEEYR